MLPQLSATKFFLDLILCCLCTPLSSRKISFLECWGSKWFFISNFYSIIFPPNYCSTTFRTENFIWIWASLVLVNGVFNTFFSLEDLVDRFGINGEWYLFVYFFKIILHGRPDFFLPFSGLIRQFFDCKLWLLMVHLRKLWLQRLLI